jgi:hypothetical protein
VNDFDGFDTGRVAVGHDQSRGGKPLSKRPPIVPNFCSASHSARVFGSLTRPDELHKQPSGVFPLSVWKAEINLFGMPCECTIDAA